MLAVPDLKQNLLAAFADIRKMTGLSGPPLLDYRAALRLARAYDDWIMNNATAGALTVGVGPGPGAIALPLAAAPLMQGWTPGLVAYWTATTWAGAGFIPVNPTIPIGIVAVAPLIAAFLAPPPKASSDDDAAAILAGILYTGTVALQVTATADDGTVTVLPVS